MWHVSEDDNDNDESRGNIFKNYALLNMLPENSPLHAEHPMVTASSMYTWASLYPQCIELRNNILASSK